MGEREDRMGTDELRVETTIIKSGSDPYSGRLCVGTPTLGTIRIEWHQARIGQIIPVNWSMVTIMEGMGGYVPLGFLVADAQNLIVKHTVEGNFDWLLLYEDDVLPPADAFIRLNQYMLDGDIPVVSGLYYAKSRPPEPLVFRGRGNGVYQKFKLGEKVWADGVPTGFLLIHTSILKAMWPDCEPYQVKGMQTRRMFIFPRDLFHDPETGHWRSLMGTSDLDWCTRVMEGGYLKKAGWDSFQRRKYPFLVDTNLFCHHISTTGELFP
ncbi:MAG: hypothetical protein UY48_C0001G0016 [Candidatus Gottesmanbacteria bacterium GW2011_GWB1_49_7]|uniref:Uncharacterized protein n=1 Tax=Candidatus Gottesmanbacteria bacterium GW2011_GWB1_49_7 TaxID=1618448 RepID=A0A0G1W464_9BACT|nr:MAG: hypothetical protein UY48_C0001G0016 [Candidatus Gottesmanbacteria bacterium GW2011_GWB1_49_7]